MLATCVVNGWDTATYRDPEHPLQQAMAADPGRADRRAGRGHRGRRLRRAGHGRHPRRAGPRVRPDRRRRRRARTRREVADAIRANPAYLGGTRRDVTALIRGHARPDRQGRRRVRVCRGAGRRARRRPEGRRRRTRGPSPVILAAVLRRLGVDSPALAQLEHSPGARATASRSAPSSPSASEGDRVRAVLQRVTRASVTRRRARSSGRSTGPGSSRWSASPTTTAPSRSRRWPARSASCGSCATSARSSTRGPRCSSSASSPSTPTPARAGARRGTPPRPAPVAEPLVDAVVAALRARGVEVATGRFGAMMEVSLVNDGPVTLVVDV